MDPMDLTSGNQQAVDSTVQRDPAPGAVSPSADLDTPAIRPDQAWIVDFVADATNHPAMYLRRANVGHDGE